MSNILTGTVARKRCGGAVRKCILLTLANIAGNDGCGIKASVRYLAAMAEVSERSIQSHLRDFVSESLIEEVGEHAVKNGKILEWALNLDTLESLPELHWKGQRHNGVSTRKPRTRRTGASPAPVQEMHPSGAGDAPLTGARAAPNLGSRDKGRESTPIVPVSSFDDAWKLWPKNVRASHKRLSQEKWLKSEKSAGPEAMLRAVRLYLASPDATKSDSQGRARGYVKAMEAWLNSQIEFWLERATESPSITSRVETSAPQWFTDLRIRFDDSCHDEHWKSMWSRFYPINPPTPGNPIVTLRAPNFNLYSIVTNPRSHDRENFKEATGYEVRVLAPEPTLSR